MCGVPFHAAQSYLSRLIKQGFKVAIAEQLDSSTEEMKNQKIFKKRRCQNHYSGNNNRGIIVRFKN